MKLSMSHIPNHPSAHAKEELRNLAPISVQLTDFATDLEYASLPGEAIETIKWHILDTLGCAVAGCESEIAQSARRAAAAMGAGGDHMVFGSPSSHSASAAAFANAVIANALDYDDGFEVAGKGMGHPGSSIVSAALSACSSPGIHGKDFIAAVAAGYEINNRLILAAQPTPQRFAEVYGISQHQAIGACIAYGRLRGLDHGALHNAIGLAGGLTPVPSLHKYNWNLRPIISLKDFVAPAALSGVLSVQLGEAGFIGSHDLFDGPTGYWRMIGSDRFDAALLLDELGLRWALLDSSFKLYPACRWLAPALEAFECLIDEHRIDPSEIAAIEVATFTTVADKLMATQPQNAIDAQFSLPYTLAALALRLPKGKEWFTAGNLNSPPLLALANKVSVRIDAVMDRNMTSSLRRPSARVSIRTRDGRHHEHAIHTPLGSTLRPADPARIREKALSNLQGLALPAEQLVGRLLRLEQEESVQNLIETLMNATCTKR